MGDGKRPSARSQMHAARCGASHMLLLLCLGSRHYLEEVKVEDIEGRADPVEDGGPREVREGAKKGADDLRETDDHLPRLLHPNTASYYGAS